MIFTLKNKILWRLRILMDVHNLRDLKLLFYILFTPSSAARYKYLFEFIKEYRPKTIMEIGTWNGVRAKQMIYTASRFHNSADIQYIGFDLFEDLTSQQEKKEFAKKPPSLQEVKTFLSSTGARISLYKGDTKKTLPKVISSLPKVDFIFASSSSIYGERGKIPFSEEDKTDRPISLYAATKKSTEQMVYAYHHLFGINCTGLRFFTCFGPWGRPDMVYFTFTENILKGKSIKVFNRGKMSRDFTCIDDAIKGVIAAIDKPFKFEIFNIGRGKPTNLLGFIKQIENCLGMKAKKEMMPMQQGDVKKTFADISKAKKMLGYNPQTSTNQGIKEFINWYISYKSNL